MRQRHRTLCRTCRTEVLVTTTEAGRHLLIDSDPDPDYGNTAVHRDHLDVLRSRRISDERPALPWERVCVPHAATCSGRTARQTAPPTGVTSLSTYRRRERDGE